MSDNPSLLNELEANLVEAASETTREDGPLPEPPPEDDLPKPPDPLDEE
jgi:hypothetical protein